VPLNTPKSPDSHSGPSSASFPYEGPLRARVLAPAEPETARPGENPDDCGACQSTDSSYIWVSDRWRVRATDRPTGLPVVLALESRSHLDFGDLPNLLAAELGVMTVRLERAVRLLPGIAQVHLHRWADDSAHLQVWFLARPTGHGQLRGRFLSLWDDVLPPVPEHEWRDRLGHLAAWLADFGGKAMVDPPRIAWQSPSEFAGDVETPTP
jgi:hypothetical protein